MDQLTPPLIRSGIDCLEDSPIIHVFRAGFRVPGLIPMWAGEPDVPTPRFICEAASAALFEGRTFYSDNRGTPALREALVGYHRRLYGVDIADDRVAFTFSGMNAVMQVAQATVAPGDNAIAVTPSWPNVMRAMQINGATMREVPLTHGNDGWRLDLDDVFAACDARTRVIYLASPGNPTGWMIEREQAERLLAFCRARNVAILSDEVYHRIVYDRPLAFSFLEIARPDDPVFVVNSFSKSWAMTGWRMGWLVYPQGCTAAFEKLIQFNTSGGLEFMQAGGIAAIEHGEEFVASLVARCRAGRDIVAERLSAMKRVRPIPAQGAFYATFEVDGMADTMAFCLGAVREARIGMAPGVSFGRGAERIVRLCYAKSPELLHEAMDRLARFVEGYAEP
jgi:aspartate/methionine/tyrosine aminotransferase